MHTFAEHLRRNKMAKITKATVKSFIKKNRANLLISCKSQFDGMSDMVKSIKDQSFSKALDDGMVNHTLGIAGAWFVGNSRDWFVHYETDTLIGIDVYNSCGSFTLAINK
jgi:hypothetical protein